MYYILKTDVYQDYGILRDPDLPDGIYFMKGALIEDELDLPLKFVTNCDEANPPREYFECTIPVCSKLMLDALIEAGVNNIQAFPAVLTSYDGGIEWDGYFALNIIGLVSAADMEKSKFVSIGEWPGGLPFVGFQHLVVDETKNHYLYLFRLAESSTEVIIHQHVVDHLKKAPPPKGWGIGLIKLENS
jgi:hypothetical protein